MSGTTEIKAALYTRLTAVSPGAALAAASIAWENRDFVPVVGTRFYAVNFLPGNPVAAAMGDAAQNRNVGVMQITIYEPKGIGDVLAQTEAERIAACFKRGTSLTYSGVTVYIVRAYRQPAMLQDAWFNLPVVVEYQADVDN